MHTETSETSLQNITGNESGVILWDNGKTWVLNWAGYEGMPREFGSTTVGLGEPLVAHPARVPAGILAVVREQEEAESGEAMSRYADLRAWRVGHEATVVVSRRWH